MPLQEIVGAVLADERITTDPLRIAAANVLGEAVQYITRREAARLATGPQSEAWLQLASSKTLFMSDGISLYRPQTACHNIGPVSAASAEITGTSGRTP